MKKLLKSPESYFPKVITDIKGFAIFMMGQDGIITSWNIGCELMKGYKSEEVIGQHYEMLFPDSFKNKAQKELDETYKNGRYETENWRRKKNGELFWAYIVLTKVIDEGGDFIGYAKITQDHTEKKKFEDELKKRNVNLQKISINLENAQENLKASSAEVLTQKNLELVKTNHDLDNFIYIASHDLKAPISNLEGLLNAFIVDKEFNQEEQPLIDMMFRSIERFKTTIKDLTEISKVQRINQKNLQALNFARILDEVKLNIRELIVSFNPVIETNFEVAEINYSKKNLRSIMYNLLSNALKYSSPDRKPEVKISTEKKKDFIVLTVSDNGLGLSKENQNKIFGMFKRAHQHIEGSGIGLYIIKRMVENAGGKIELKSEVGKGTTFSVYLKIS